jgi:hypothetical protein
LQDMSPSWKSMRRNILRQTFPPLRMMMNKCLTQQVLFFFFLPKSELPHNRVNVSGGLTLREWALSVVSILELFDRVSGRNRFKNWPYRDFWIQVACVC